MDRLEAYDKAVIVRDYLRLIWNAHEGFEGTNEEDIACYRLGVQTFIEKIEEEVEDIIKALEESNDE